MFLYTSDFSSLTHYIIEHFVKNKNIAIDATLGNGYDTNFLSEKFKNVIAFDIRKEACEKYLEHKNSNVTIINDSHNKFKEYINSKVDCIVYNLGFLPGGDKSITTIHTTSLESIKAGLDILSNGALMLITVYRGHEEGKIEYLHIGDYLINLPKDKYAVMKHEIVNRSENSPMLFVVEKK